MSELDRARAHLKYERANLAAARRLPDLSDRALRAFEEPVLAALSWVWEEQEKERRERLDRFWERIDNSLWPTLKSCV